MQPDSLPSSGLASSAPSTGSDLLQQVNRWSVQDFLSAANWAGEAVAAQPLGAPEVQGVIASVQIGTFGDLDVAQVNSGGETPDLVAPATDLISDVTPDLTPMRVAETGYVKSSEAAWLGLTVTQFFERQNWQGLAQVPQPQANVPAAARLLNPEPQQKPTLSLAVQDFFGHLPWDATPAIGALPKTEAITPAAEPKMTLSDLSNLF
jgi:hypothetical protein